MRAAALDLGSNTFILTIVERYPNGEAHVLCDEVRYVRLGEGVDKSKKLLPEALERAKLVLAEFRELITLHAPEVVLATATSAARDASNGQELIDICHSFSIPVEIITGIREAELTFKGSRFFQKLTGNHWVIDIGGGSTEIIYGNAHGISWTHSFDLGCVRLFERWGRDYDKIVTQIEEQFQAQLPEGLLQQAQACIAVAGTPVELVRILESNKFSIEICEGYQLNGKNLDLVIQVLKENTSDDLMRKYNTPKGRADVLFVGALLLKSFLEFSKVQNYVVSRAGIRFGVLQNLWDP